MNYLISQPENTFNKINSYLQEIKILWNLCTGICIDNAPTMTGSIKGFVAHVREHNTHILVIVFCIVKHSLQTITIRMKSSAGTIY